MYAVRPRVTNKEDINVSYVVLCMQSPHIVYVLYLQSVLIVYMQSIHTI